MDNRKPAKKSLSPASIFHHISLDALNPFPTAAHPFSSLSRKHRLAGISGMSPAIAISGAAAPGALEPPSKPIQEGEASTLGSPGPRSVPQKKGTGLNISTPSLSSFLAIDDPSKAPKTTKGRVSSPPFTAALASFRDRARARKLSMAPMSSAGGIEGESARLRILPTPPIPVRNASHRSIAPLQGSGYTLASTPRSAVSELSSRTSVDGSGTNSSDSTPRRQNRIHRVPSVNMRECDVISFRSLRPAPSPPLALPRSSSVKPRPQPTRKFSDSCHPSVTSLSSTSSSGSQKTVTDPLHQLEAFERTLTPARWKNGASPRGPSHDLPSAPVDAKADEAPARSWRGLRRGSKDKTNPRPLSAQHLPKADGDVTDQRVRIGLPITRQTSETSGLIATPRAAPPVPPRSASRPAFSPGISAAIKIARQADGPGILPLPVPTKSSSIRRKEHRLSTDEAGPPLLRPSGKNATKGASAPPVASRSALQLRPLPPLPPPTIAPPKSGLLQGKFPTRLLRPKRSSTPHPIISDPILLSPNTLEAGSPFKLIARDEPSAALGKRASAIADRRLGVTALSFLACEDGEKASRLSNLRARPSDSAAIACPESPVIHHIMPPEERSKIGLEDRKYDPDVDSDDYTPRASEDDVNRFVRAAEQSKFGGMNGRAVRSSLRINTALAGYMSPVALLDARQLSCSPTSPPLRQRSGGPVAPPRRSAKMQTQRYSSNGKHDGQYPTPRSPPPPLRPRKRTISPSTASMRSALSPASASFGTVMLPGSFGEASNMREPSHGRVLPKCDRPVTMGQWDSPPISPKCTEQVACKETWNLPIADNRQTAKRKMNDTLPVSADGDFGPILSDYSAVAAFKSPQSPSILRRSHGSESDELQTLSTGIPDVGKRNFNLNDGQDEAVVRVDLASPASPREIGEHKGLVKWEKANEAVKSGGAREVHPFLVGSPRSARS